MQTLLIQIANLDEQDQSYPVRLYEHGAACIAALEDFVDAIRTDRPPACTVDEAAKTVLACLAGIESYRSGYPVRVKTLEEVS